VPLLPADELKLGDLTLRETLARHRADPTCATCHQRIDSFGLVFEGYGPVGERRNLDLGGHPVETSATSPAAATAPASTASVRTSAPAAKTISSTPCRQLLAYGLGRSLLLSDDLTIADSAPSWRPTDTARHADRLHRDQPQFLNRRANAGSRSVWEGEAPAEPFISPAFMPGLDPPRKRRANEGSAEPRLPAPKE